jgi:hypothetical protein
MRLFETLQRELRSWLRPIPSESNFLLVEVLPTAPLPAEQVRT